ncbi:MAG: hypothetical protein NTV46_16985 [Verrucomicrobia bacterium]|nr:hypothetical protein [Verrucomicrobiota bacterium]
MLAVAAVSLALQSAPETPDEISRQILAPLLDHVKVATLKGDLQFVSRAGGDDGSGL